MSSPTTSQFETAVMIRRILFVLVLLTLAASYLFPLFRGLSSPQAMDQAQIARNVARGEGLTTKFIRPLAYYEAEKAAQGPVPFTAFKDTYHAPLNPLILGAVLKIVGADKPDSWTMKPNQRVWHLDRVIALVSTLFFLLAIGMTYLLVLRIFDQKIAGVTAVLMLLCDLFWQFSQSGLPQMLLLFLFSSGLYFTYRAVEASQEGRMPLAPALVATIFFVLMVLAHWLTAWIFLGFLIFAAVAFKPRGIVALSGLALLAIAIAYPLVRNAGASGQPLGTGFYVLYNGLASGAESSIMRNHDLESEPLSLDGMLLKILATTLVQALDILPFLGGIVAAPLFFIALIHPFKRASIAQFRWAILLMWVFAAFGMALYGVDRANPIDPNQIHLLFAPVMAAYGLAFISILWNRLDVVSTVPMLKNAHFIIIVLFSASPILLTLPNKLKIGIMIREQGWPQWPPYMPGILNRELAEITKPENGKQGIVVSDQPWAVAWYADRLSVWLPKTLTGFDQLESRAASLGTPFTGILITPSSHGSGNSYQVRTQYGDFSSMVFNGRVMDITSSPNNRTPLSIYANDPKLAEISRRYPYPLPMQGAEIIYYSERFAARGTTR